MRLSDVTAGMVNRWSARLMSDGYSGATVNGYVNTIRLLLGYALKWDVIEDLPIKKSVDKYKVNLPCNELSLDEERRFLAAFDDEPAFRGWMRSTIPVAACGSSPRQGRGSGSAGSVSTARVSGQ
ncbi:MAG TPA: hypothetical protein VJ276_04220 [Thermoanaerobaculia bacterium]|nr:hypothetical protein [Thermoanaerobaculia bacterium]